MKRQIRMWDVVAAVVIFNVAAGALFADLCNCNCKEILRVMQTGTKCTKYDNPTCLAPKSKICAPDSISSAVCALTTGTTLKYSCVDCVNNCPSTIGIVEAGSNGACGSGLMNSIYLCGGESGLY